MAKKYSIIYSDPAWTFKTFSEKGKGRSAENHYICSSLDKMKEIPVCDMAEKDCALFMWATYPNLKDAFELGEAWGFKYKTVAFTWVKQCKVSDGYHVGMGYYTRANPEICLLFTRGKPLKRISKSVRNLCISRLRDHSQKPDEIRNRIVEMFGDLPRIEMFARAEFEGWDSWGYEVDLPF